MNKKLKIGKRTGLKYFGYADIKSWDPCYDPIKHVPATWRGTAVDVLKNETVPFADRLWCVLRSEIVSERVMRLFAVWAYRDTLNWVKNPNPLLIEAVNVAERFANGEATNEELAAARSAAWAWEATPVEWSTAAVSASGASAMYSVAARSVRAVVVAASGASVAELAGAESRQKDKLIEMILAEAKQLKGLI